LAESAASPTVPYSFLRVSSPFSGANSSPRVSPAAAPAMNANSESPFITFDFYKYNENRDNRIIPKVSVFTKKLKKSIDLHIQALIYEKK